MCLNNKNYFFCKLLGLVDHVFKPETFEADNVFKPSLV